MINKANLLKTDSDQKIKTIGMGPNYIIDEGERYFKYKGIPVEVIQPDDYFIGGHLDKVKETYTRFARNACSKETNDIMILSRVGEHLFDIQYQLYDIFKSNHARHLLLALPEMNKIYKRLAYAIDECSKRNCMDENLKRNALEILSCGDDMVDLHHVWTSVDTVDYFLYPLNTIEGIIKKVEVIETGVNINGYPHFILSLVFDKNLSLANHSGMIPVGDIKYNTDIHKKGVYLECDGIQTQISDLKYLDFDEILKEHRKSKPKRIIFNRCLSKNGNIDYAQYAMCGYIRPGTEIVVIEDNMGRIARRLMDINIDYQMLGYGAEEYWSLNNLLFGGSFQYLKKYSHTPMRIGYRNQEWASPRTIDIFMTQESLYKCNKHSTFDPELFGEMNEFTFCRCYTRI